MQQPRANGVFGAYLNDLCNLPDQEPLMKLALSSLGLAALALATTAAAQPLLPLEEPRWVATQGHYPPNKWTEYFRNPAHLQPGYYQSDLILPEGKNCARIRRGGDLAFVRCAAVPDQTFTFIHQGPFTEYVAKSFTRSDGWMPGPGGRLLRVAAIEGMDITGADYTNEPTENDMGRACAIRCLGDNRCRAFTWTPPAGQNALHPTRQATAYTSQAETVADWTLVQRCKAMQRPDFDTIQNRPCVPGGPVVCSETRVYVKPAACNPSSSGSRINVNGQPLEPLAPPPQAAGPKGRCWLKSSTPAARANPLAVSGIVRP